MLSQQSGLSHSFSEGIPLLPSTMQQLDSNCKGHDFLLVLHIHPPGSTELHSLPAKLSSSFVLCPLLNFFINETKNLKESTKSLEMPRNITSFGNEICQCMSNLKVCVPFNPTTLPVQNHFITVHIHIDNFDGNTHCNT